MNGGTNWLGILLSGVVLDSLRIGKVGLLMHRRRCYSWTAGLAIWRGTLRLHALWLKCRRHAASHLLVRQWAVCRLGGVVGHVRVVVLRGETAASTTVWRIAAASHIGVAHIAVR